MVSEIIHNLDFNFAYANKLVEDVSDEQMAIKPSAGLDNHPAFTLGHLVTACANLVNNLTGQFILPDGWKEIFQRTGPGDPSLPNPDAKVYPSKAELLRELKIQHERLISILMKMDKKKLNENFQWRFSSFLPTYLDRIMFLCVNHYAMHLGQLAAWRRAMGMKSALGELK
ncbi:MAG: DinB family protein [Bacteroidetes bacterium]|nr:DinB family protein [Bacteroidota bacterium]